MAPPPGSQERRTSLRLPKEKGKSLDSRARGAARPETPRLPATGRVGGHSPRRRLCTAGARGTPISRPPWSQGPGGWARCARPSLGLAEATREGGREEGGLTRGGLTASSCGPQGPGGCDRKAESRAVRCQPPCCGRLPPSRSPRPSDSRDPVQARAHNRLLPPQPTCHSQSQPTLADGPPPPPPGVSAPPPCRSASAQTRGEGPLAGRSRGGREGGEVRAKAVCCQAS